MHWCMGTNWSAIKFDWNQVRAFMATAELGSLSGAARALGTTQPTVGRQVTALEEDLGVALFERVGRGLVLTPSGKAVLDEVRPMGEAALRVSLVAAGRVEDVRGTVSISVSDLVATYLVPDLLMELSARVPEIVVDLVVTNAISDLMRRDADIALRHVEPDQPDLIARRVRSGEAGLWASAGFLQRHGRPQSIADLAGLPFVGMSEPAQMLSYLQSWGLPTCEADIRVHTDSMIVAWEMVRQGVGLGVMSDEIALRTEGVERVLPDFAPLPVHMWLTTHRELRTSQRIRVVFDVIAEVLTR